MGLGGTNRDVVVMDTEADGVTDVDADGVTDKDADGVTDKDADGVTDEDADGVTDEDADGVTDVDADGVTDEDADGVTDKEGVPTNEGLRTGILKFCNVPIVEFIRVSGLLIGSIPPEAVLPDCDRTAVTHVIQAKSLIATRKYRNK